MIGHDIIDLHFLPAFDRSRYAKYARKILHPAEMKIYQGAPQPNYWLWQCWALKESAYKFFFRKTPERLFAPKKYYLPNGTHLLEHQVHLIRSPFGEAWGEVHCTTQIIKATVVGNRADLGRYREHQFQLSSTLPALQAKETRLAVAGWLSQILVVDPRKVNLDNHCGYPIVRISGRNIPRAISWSHHGHQGSVAVL